MHHDIPTTDEIIALVEANPGFVVKDYVNSLDWGDLDLHENREARDKYAHGMVIRISRLIRQGYLVREGTKPSKFSARETVTSGPMKGLKYKHYVEYNGEILPLAELCKKYDAAYYRVYYHVIKSGKPIEEVLTEPSVLHERHTRDTGAGIEILGHRYTPEILLELRCNPGQCKIQLASKIGTTRTVLNRLDELEREGWIEVRKGGLGGAHHVMLTHKGGIVADGLMAIERRLQ